MSKFSIFNLFEIVNLWFFYTIYFGFILFWHLFLLQSPILKKKNVLGFNDSYVRIIDVGSIPEKCIRCTLLILPYWKQCIFLLFVKCKTHIFHVTLFWHGYYPLLTETLFLVRRDESPENYCHSPGVVGGGVVVVVVVVVRRQKL